MSVSFGQIIFFCLILFLLFGDLKKFRNIIKKKKKELT